MRKYILPFFFLSVTLFLLPYKVEASSALMYYRNATEDNIQLLPFLNFSPVVPTSQVVVFDGLIQGQQLNVIVFIPAGASTVTYQYFGCSEVSRSNWNITVDGSDGIMYCLRLLVTSGGQVRITPSVPFGNGPMVVSANVVDPGSIDYTSNISQIYSVLSSINSELFLTHTFPSGESYDYSLAEYSRDMAEYLFAIRDFSSDINYIVDSILDTDADIYQRLGVIYSTCSSISNAVVNSISPNVQSILGQIKTYLPYLPDIRQQEIYINSKLDSLLNMDSQQETALANLQDSYDSKKQQGADLIQDNSYSRPSISAADIDISNIVDTGSSALVASVFGSLFNNSLISTMMLIVIMAVFIRFVLFGKSG